MAAVAFLICPSICFSSYIIHLKDGGEFATEQYFEEGDQIKFKRYGGVRWIQKGLVTGIEEIKDLPEEQEARANKQHLLRQKKAPERHSR